jgi:hypothetical protein
LKLTASVLAIAGMAGALLLSGCGMPGISSLGGGGGLFGSKKSDDSWTPVTEEAMLTAARSDTGGSAVNAGAAEGECPVFNPWVPEKILTVYEAGHTNDSMAVIHRGEITKTARECSAEGSRMTVKYGLGGRVLLGPKGHPGPVLLPLAINVYDSSRNIVKSMRVKVQTQVGADEPAAYFSLVDTVEFNMAPGAAVKDYKIFVSFDQSGGAMAQQAGHGGKKRAR